MEVGGMGVGWVAVFLKQGPANVTARAVGLFLGG